MKGYPGWQNDRFDPEPPEEPPTIYELFAEADNALHDARESIADARQAVAAARQILEAAQEDPSET